MAQVIIQLLISGIAMGFLYCLVATEYSLVYNATDLLNFGHDKFILLGAYVILFVFMMSLGMHIWLAVPATLVLMFFVGVLTSFGIFNPLSKMSSRLYAGIGTMVLGKIIGEVVRIVFGTVPQPVNYLKGSVRVLGITVTHANLVIIAVSLVLVVGLQFLFKKTKAGKAMRCVNQNKNAAALMGINVPRSTALITGVSVMICAVVGILIAPLNNVTLTMSGVYGAKGFAAGIIGGFGSLPGAVIGGLLLGVVENLSVLIMPAVYKDIVSYVLMILFLLIKPDGLMGRRST